jgi:HipA-like C-terminal domain
MATVAASEQTRLELLTFLALRGSASGAEAARALGLSQSSFSRLVGTMRDSLFVTGKARAVRYAATRDVPGVGRSVPVYEIDEARAARKIAILHAVRSNGFFVEGLIPEVPSRFHQDLPYFLHDLRPAGFLGRLIPRRHPELDAPADIQRWTSNHCLEYVARFGWNLPGNLVVGDEAFRLYVANSVVRGNVVARRDRKLRYPEIAEDAMAAGLPGSSAAGEQPKFIALRGPEPVEVLVKFTPAIDSPVAQRIADLLIAEHVAHVTMHAHGHASPRSEIIVAKDRVFLEVQRFDRTPEGGRRGVLSMFALDAEFVGALGSWTETAAKLESQRRISTEQRREIAWRELFGRLIANTDMHAGNLAFFAHGERLLDLAPTYDMLPMSYYPQQSHLRRPELAPPLPGPEHAGNWVSALGAATAFWNAVAADVRISADFRTIAAENRKVLDRLRAAGDLLPPG